MPRIKVVRRTLGLGRLALALLGVAPASAEPLQLPLACTFKTTGVGQFHGLDYAPGPIGSLSTISITAAPADLRVGRAAIVEGSRAKVADLRLRPEQATLVSQDAQATTLLAIFTAAATSGGLPATYVRNEVIGTIPVTIQGTGTCHPASSSGLPGSSLAP